jgi:hypothetical protein
MKNENSIENFIGCTHITFTSKVSLKRNICSNKGEMKKNMMLQAMMHIVCFKGDS